MAAKKHLVPAEQWEQWYNTYATPDFIANDPISLIHGLKHRHSELEELEFASFLVCTFAYGARPIIIKTMGQVLQTLGPKPLNTLLSWSPKQLNQQFKGFYYRLHQRQHLLGLLQLLQQVYQTHGSLQQLWRHTARPQQTHQQNLSCFSQGLLQHCASPTVFATTAGKFLLPDAGTGSAAKRLNMFLRWVVRQDAVDLGLWRNSVSPAELVFPLDTHVGQQSRKYKLTARKTDNWHTAEEITAYFRRLNPDDPVKYDLAMMGLGTGP